MEAGSCSANPYALSTPVCCVQLPDVAFRRAPTSPRRNGNVLTARRQAALPKPRGSGAEWDSAPVDQGYFCPSMPPKANRVEKQRGTRKPKNGTKSSLAVQSTNPCNCNLPTCLGFIPQGVWIKSPLRSEQPAGHEWRLPSQWTEGIRALLTRAWVMGPLLTALKQGSEVTSGGCQRDFCLWVF